MPRRGYGNHTTLAWTWQEALVRLEVTPCPQYQYVAVKNTSDIALALGSIEALFDRSADTFCLATSGSDFAYLCRKLRNASDQFFEWVKPEAVTVEPPKATVKTEVYKAEPAKPAPKLRPKFVAEAVTLLAADTPEGKVSVGGLGSLTNLRRTGRLVNTGSLAQPKWSLAESK